MKKLDAGTIGTMSTSELVKFYNENSGADPVKKFADRKTAERRVLALASKEVDHSAANKRISAALPVLKTAKVLADRSAAVARTWQDPAVAAVRAVRDHVIVDGAWYVSVRQAFIDLELPLNEHVKFRKKLKEVGAGIKYEMSWEVTKGGKDE